MPWAEVECGDRAPNSIAEHRARRVDGSVCRYRPVVPEPLFWIEKGAGAPFGGRPLVDIVSVPVDNVTVPVSHARVEGRQGTEAAVRRVYEARPCLFIVQPEHLGGHVGERETSSIV